MDLAQAPLWFQAMVLGIIQGITEFLPISSSGHLVLVPELTHWSYLGKEFDVALHLGTLVAILIYYKERALRLVRGLGPLAQRLGNGWQGEWGPDDTLLYYIVVASIPAGILGLLCDDFLEAHFNHMASIAFFLALFGLLMGWSERVGSKALELEDLNLRGAMLIGAAQALALMPGVSRSGSTMTMALLLGLTRTSAADFSFLMALPITIAACLLKGIKMANALAISGQTALLLPCAIGVVTSFCSGLLCMHFLMRYLKSNTFSVFVVYRLALAAFLLGWMLTHQAGW